jgi:hydroxymethylbilane synthase
MVAKIILGTRGSELARAQTLLVEKAIRQAHPGLTIETKVIATQGDKTKALDPRAGRKGLFTAEIERALLVGDVDIAVHSAKDLPSEISPDLEVAAALPRAAMDDVLVSKHPGGLASLLQGATVATGSVRRQHQLLWRRADLHVIDLRGNVPTRLRKLAENDWDAIVLARAGLERLGMLEVAHASGLRQLPPAQARRSRHVISFEGRRFFLDILSQEIFLSSGGQGIIAIQVRTCDQSTKAVVDLINHRETLLCLQAEREFLRGLRGDCNCPVGVLAKIENGKMKIRAQVFVQDAVAPRQGEVEGAPDDREQIVAELLNRLGEPASAQGYGFARKHE